VALIVLEGCDGSGKTTLARALTEAAERDRKKVLLLHKGPPTDDRTALQEYTEDLSFYEPALDHRHLVICDRWHLGEVVYGPVYRGGSRLSEADLSAVERFLHVRGALKLLLDASNDTLVRRAFVQRGEDFLQLGDVQHVAREYRRLFTVLGMWRHVHTDHPYDVNELLDAADRLETWAVERRLPCRS
jgi:thymidylate kinase